MAKLMNPKTFKWMAGISSIILGASQITTPINLKEMLPEFVTNPLIGNLSPLGIAAYGAFIGGFLVLAKLTE